MSLNSDSSQITGSVLAKLIYVFDKDTKSCIVLNRESMQVNKYMVNYNLRKYGKTQS